MEDNSEKTSVLNKVGIRLLTDRETEMFVGIEVKVERPDGGVPIMVQYTKDELEQIGLKEFEKQHEANPKMDTPRNFVSFGQESVLAAYAHASTDQLTVTAPRLFIDTID